MADRVEAKSTWWIGLAIERGALSMESADVPMRLLNMSNEIARVALLQLLDICVSRYKDTRL